MNLMQVVERIQVWLSMYHQHEGYQPQHPLAVAIKAGVDASWDNGLLKNAAEIETARELVGTPAEEQLAQARALAGTTDRSHLPEIAQLLQQVGQFIGEKFFQKKPKKGPSVLE